MKRPLFLPTSPTSCDHGSTRATRPAARSGSLGRLAVWPLCALFAATVVQCGGEEEGPGGGTGGMNNTDLGAGLGTGGGDGFAGGAGLDQDGGRTELTAEQVDQILGAECTGWSGEGETVPATLQLVVDTSGSMDNLPPGSQDGDPHKWAITKAALTTAIAALPPAVSLGVVYYPNKNVTSSPRANPGPTDNCVETSAAVPLAPLGDADSEQRATFQTSLDEVLIDSYTPTHDAYAYSLAEQLVPYPAANKYLLLITDGAPNIDLGCTWPGDGEEVVGDLYDGAGNLNGATDPIIAAVQAARDQHGIRTFVIGSPGSEESEQEPKMDMRPWLSRAAIAGGTDTPGCTIEGPNYCHFDMTQTIDFASELAAGLANISEQVADDCTFVVPEAQDGRKIDPAKTQVIIEWSSGKKSLIIPDGIDDCTDGWKFNSADQTIVLCPTTCDEVQADAGERIHVSFGCERQVIDDIVQ